MLPTTYTEENLHFMWSIVPSVRRSWDIDLSRHCSSILLFLFIIYTDGVIVTLDLQHVKELYKTETTGTNGLIVYTF